MPRPRPEKEKRCPQCHTIKLLSEFYSSEKYDGGYSTYCKDCSRKDNKQRYPKYREKIKASAKEYRAKLGREICAARTRENTRRMKAKNPARWRAKRFLEREGIDSSLTK